MSRAGSVFPVLSLDRGEVHWDDYLDVMTPVEEAGGILVKRDDWFAPLGYGGVNGSKVRQILFLVRDYLNALPAGAKPGLLLAGSVLSPQLGRVAAIARHLGIPAALVLGAGVETAIRHENVACAARLGAIFYRAKAPYNPALQARARELHTLDALRDFYLMEYGLSVDGPMDRIERFYRFASEQVRSIPPDVETLLVPAGSCNTTIAVLYGVARFQASLPNLRRVVLFGIAPPRVEWFEDRLRRVGEHAGLDIGGLFHRRYVHHAGLDTRFDAGRRGPILLEHHDLHASKFAAYDTRMPVDWDGIPLHPNYEGKIITYMRARAATFQGLLSTTRTMLWVVGSEPSWAAMERPVLDFLRRASR